MHKASFLALLLSCTLTSTGLRAADEPAASPSPAADPTPVGTWNWFVGPPLTITAAGAVTGASRPAVWFWTNQGNHELEIVWGGPRAGLDKLTLSEDGDTVEGNNDDGTPISGHRQPPPASVPVAKPVAASADNLIGKWKFHAPELTFREDGTATGKGVTARWEWSDKAKRELLLTVAGEGSPLKETMVLSIDGGQLQNARSVGMALSGERATPLPSAPTPEGSWKWFNGRETITFKGENTSSNSGSRGTWKWTDDTHRTLSINWDNIPFVDTLTLSDDNNRLEGTNNVGDEVSGDRIFASAAKSAE